MSVSSLSTRFAISKLDPERRLVFGWANVSITKDGRILTDTQDDQITPSELESGAYNFVLEYRASDEMHNEQAVGEMVESMMFTDDKLVKFATDPSTGKVDENALTVLKQVFPARWWIGFKLNPEAFEKVKKGEYTMFSIGGEADRVGD